MHTLPSPQSHHTAVGVIIHAPLANQSKDISNNTSDFECDESKLLRSAPSDYYDNYYNSDSPYDSYGSDLKFALQEQKQKQDFALSIQNVQSQQQKNVLDLYAQINKSYASRRGASSKSANISSSNSDSNDRCPIGEAMIEGKCENVQIRCKYHADESKGIGGSDPQLKRCFCNSEFDSFLDPLEGLNVRGHSPFSGPVPKGVLEHEPDKMVEIRWKAR